MSVDSIEARLWEISENLHRAELTKLERSEQVAEWVRLTLKQEDGEPNKGAEPRPPSGGKQPNDKGIKAASRELGIARTNVQQSVKIAAIAPEAKETARADYANSSKELFGETANHFSRGRRDQGENPARPARQPSGDWARRRMIAGHSEAGRFIWVRRSKSRA
jgi:hypothetical protein